MPPATMYNSAMFQRLLVVVTCLAAAAGCSRTRDLTKDIKLVDVRSGWLAAESPDGQNKIVPSVSITIQNVSNEPIDGVQINAIFRRVGEQEVWGEHFTQGVGRAGLGAGAKAKALVLRSPLGYTSPQTRGEMLRNREFVDTFVRVFGKHGSRTWVKIGEFQIDRQLLTTAGQSPSDAQPAAITPAQ